MTQKLSMNLACAGTSAPLPTEAQNHFFWLDTKNANGGLCYADPKLSTNGVAPGRGYANAPILRYCGSVPHPGQKTPFAPRFGLNYRLTDKTVLRGGYGIFYDSYEGREIDDSADIYPYSIRNSLNPTGNATVAKLSNQMFPVYNTLGPFPASTLSFMAVIESENPLDPYVESWTVSGERELARNTTLEVNYIGTHCHPPARPAQHRPALCLSQSDQRVLPAAGCQRQLHQPEQRAVQSICSGEWRVSRLPYPNFTGFYIDSDFHGYSHYNAMNVKFEHRARDMAITAVYTWAQQQGRQVRRRGRGRHRNRLPGLHGQPQPPT